MLRSSRAVFSRLAVSITLSLGVASTAGAAGSYEELADSTVNLDELTQAAKDFARDCSCAPEAEKAACDSAKDAASKVLKKGQKVRVPFTNKAVELGKYSKNRKQLALKIEGGLLSEADVPACPVDSDCASQTEARGLPVQGTNIEVTTASQNIWSGSVALEPEQATQLEEIPSRIQGEAIFELTDAQTRTLDRKERSDWKAAQVKAVGKEIDELKGQLKTATNESRDYVQQLINTSQEQLACVKKADTRGTQLTLKLRTLGQRIFVRDPRFQGYLVSEPASAQPPPSGETQANGAR